MTIGWNDVGNYDDIGANIAFDNYRHRLLIKQHAFEVCCINHPDHKWDVSTKSEHAQHRFYDIARGVVLCS